MADAREVGRRFIDAFNAHDQQRIRNLNGDDTVFEAPGEVKVEGRLYFDQVQVMTQLGLMPEPATA